MLQAMPEFPTKGRWEWMWFERRDKTFTGRRALPGGAIIDCNLTDYNEAWIWMRLHDAAELDVLRGLLHPGETFVDAGAHIGVWSLVAAAAVGKNGRIFSIEPNPATFKKLATNLGMNAEIAQMTPYQAAASATSGTARLQITDFSECCSLAEGDGPFTEVPTVTLDGLLKESRCHGLKIDVEGHELSVLEGAPVILQRDHPWLCVEFNNTIHKLKTVSEWPVHQKLSAMGYECRLFRDANGGPRIGPDFATDGFVNLFYSMPK